MGSTLTDRIAAVVDRYAYSGGTHGHHDAAVRILAEPAVADALRAVDVVRALTDRHRPVRWAADSAVVVCSCGAGAYDHCPDGLILRGRT